MGGWLVLGVGSGSGDIAFWGRFDPRALGVEVMARTPGGRRRVWRRGASVFQGALVGLAAGRGRIALDLGGIGQPAGPNQ